MCVARLIASPQPLTMTTKRDAAKLMLTEAADLCSVCAGYWRDETDRINSGTKVHYAIDVDVVMMYADPQQHRDSGNVFSQAHDVSIMITNLVSDYIFHDMSTLTPLTAEGATAAQQDQLILISPHDLELKNIVMKMSNNVAEQVGSAAQNIDAEMKLKIELLSRQSIEQADSVFFTTLSSELSVLCNLAIGGTGDAAKMARLNRLPLARVASLRDHWAFLNTDGLQPPPSRDDSTKAGVEMMKLADDWYELMLEVGHPSKTLRGSNFDNDAWVLATLQWVNADAVRRNINQRMVLVTGTKRMFEAGKARAASHSGFDNFADAYLRNPRAFMGAKDFFSTSRGASSDTAFRILEWMSVLFPNSIVQRRVKPEPPSSDQTTVDVSTAFSSLRAFASGTGLDAAVDILLSAEYQRSNTMSFPDDAIDEWRKVVRDTNAKLVVGRSEAFRKVAMSKLTTGLPEKGDRYQVLMDRLSKHVQTSFANLYLTTGVIGVEQLLDKNSSMRGLPALRFDLPDFAEAQRQYEALSDELFKKDRGVDQFDLARMYGQLAKSDDSNYHAHVLHAYVYASTGRWFSARTLCRVALLVADSLPRETAGRRLGREAAYLMAVAERRLAIDTDKLVLAEHALEDAKRRSPGTEAQDVRFASERFAQSIARGQLDYFSGLVELPFDPVVVLNEAIRLCNLGASGGEPRGVRRWVVRQSATNGLLGALIASLSGHCSSESEECALQLISIVESERLAPNLPDSTSYLQLYPDEISDFIWLIAVAKFSDSAKSNKAKARLKNWRTASQTHYSLPFEQMRQNRFMNLVNIQSDLS